MGYIDLAKELKKHFDVVENTFEHNNLQLIRFSVKPYSEDDADCSIIVEFSSLEGTTIPESIYIKVNLYDEDDDIYLAECAFVNCERFDGYDTVSIIMDDDGKTLMKAKSGRMFITRCSI